MGRFGHFVRLLDHVACGQACALLQAGVLLMVLLLLWVVVMHLSVFKGVVGLGNAVLFHERVSDGVVQAIFDNRE